MCIFAVENNIHTKYINMKQRLFYFLLLIIPWTDIWGQVPFTSVTIEDVDMPAAKGMVRSWKPNFAVAYQTDGTDHYFSIIENYNTVMKSVKFSGSNMFIHDMQILGDTLYFCGSQGGVGFINFVKISDIYNSSGTNILNTGAKFSLDPTLSYTVSRMAVYYDNYGTQHVAAFGYWDEHTTPYIYRRYFLAETYFQSNGRIFTADWAVSNSDGSHIQGPINDVVATDHYVAFVGTSSGCSQLSIRRVNRNYVVGTQYVYNYNCPSTGNPVATAMRGDNIAVASANTYTPVTSQIEIRSIDLGTMNMYDAQKFAAPEKSIAEDIIYAPHDNKLLVIPMLWETTGDHYPVIYIDPGRTTPYNALAMTSTNIRSYQINLHDNDYFLLGGGGKVFAHYISSLDPNDNCINIEKYKIEAINTIGCIEDDYYLRNLSPTYYSNNITLTEHHYNVKCIYNN